MVPSLYTKSLVLSLSKFPWSPIVFPMYVSGTSKVKANVPTLKVALTVMPVDNAMEITSGVSLVTDSKLYSSVSFTLVRLVVTLSPLYKTIICWLSVSLISTYIISKCIIEHQKVSPLMSYLTWTTSVLSLLALKAIALNTVALVSGAASFVRACISKSTLSGRNRIYSPSPLNVY